MNYFLQLLIGIGYLLPIKFVFFPIPTNRFFLYLFSLLYLFRYAKAPLYKGYRSIVTAAFLLVAWIFLVQIQKPGFDLTIQLFIIESTVLFPLASLYLVKNVFSFTEPYDLVEFLLNIMVFQAVTMIMMMFIPHLKFIVLSVIISGVPDNIYFFRHVGLTGFSAYNMGVFLNFSLLFVLFLITYGRTTITTKKLFIYLGKLLLVLVSSLLVSRTGIIIIGLIILFSLILLGRTIYLRKSVIKLYILISIGVSLIIIILLTMARENPKFADFLAWSFDVFISLFSGKKVQGVEVLSDFYWMPSESTFFFGDGCYSDPNGGYYMGTDAGYMRILLLMGFIGSILYYFLYAYQLLTYYFYVKSYNRALSIYFIVLLVGLLLIQYKGNIFIDGNELLRMASLIFVSVLIMKSSKEIRYN